MVRRRKTAARAAHRRVRHLRRTVGCGRGLTAHQRSVVRTALREAHRLGARWKARVALIAAGIVESRLRNLTWGHADSEGWLQVRVGIHGRRVARSVILSTRKFLIQGFWGRGGAIQLARRTGWTAGRIAQAVQGSAYPAKYGREAGRASRLVRCFG